MAPTWPAPVAGAVIGAVVVGFCLAVAAFAISTVGNEFSLGRSLFEGSVILMLLSVPPLVAMLARPRRPLMLLPAGIMGLVGIVALGSIVALPLVVLGVIWLWAYAKMAPTEGSAKKISMVLVPVLWLAATTMLWIHLDPACEQGLGDGTIIEVDPASRGLQSGWTWEIGSSFAGSSGSMSDEVVFEVCKSNSLEPWEAALALALCLAAVVVALFLAVSATGTSGSRSADSIP